MSLIVIEKVKKHYICAIVATKQWQDLISKQEAPINVMRWYNLIKSQDAVTLALQALPEEAKKSLQPSSRQSMERRSTNVRPQEGKFVELPGAEMGKVVVRFPPEASG